jgi:tRNA(Met) cytidine acetyltransferase
VNITPDPARDWHLLHVEARRLSVRLALVISGSTAFADPWLPRLLAATPTMPERIDGSRPARELRERLGTDTRALLIDASAGLDLDLLGLIAGTLRGGGSLLLRLPLAFTEAGARDASLTRYAAYPHCVEAFANRYALHFMRTLQRHDGLGWLHPGGYRPPRLAKPSRTMLICSGGSQPTGEQADAVDAVAALMTTASLPATLVLRSGRGRGKSTVLGMAAAHLARRHRILLTAARGGGTEVARQWFLRHGGDLKRLQTLPPDTILRRCPEADLLLVDEAAALPAAQLHTLLRHYPRAVLASTAEGYEGTGRGLDLSFTGILDRERPGWQRWTLRQPMRWSRGDALEPFLRETLMPESRPAEDDGGDTPADGLQPERLDRNTLARDPALLAATMNLLATAHYRTRPNDLRVWLDAPGVELWALRHGARLYAVAVTVAEGGIDRDLAAAVSAGERRLRGHALAQSLAAHADAPEALILSGQRVARIAVLGRYRRRGLGARLLNAIAETARAAGCDWVGASFGAEPTLLSFWRQAGIDVVRAGARPDPVTGRTALLTLRGLSPAGDILNRGLQRALARDLPLISADPDWTLDVALTASVMASLPPPAGVTRETDRRIAARFAAGRCDYLTALPSLHRLLATAPAQARLPALRARIEQRTGWRDCIRRLQLPGRRALLGALRSEVSELLRQP